MSFSRAPVKRFNEHVGCAPPPGSYEIKPEDLKGAASFEKSDRFRHLKAATGAPMPSPLPSRNVLVSPVRRTLSVDGLVEESSVKKEKNGMTVDRKQMKLLEKEIRSLVQQRGEQDRRLMTLDEELKKVEAKLLAAVREKTGLAANVTTLERQKTELKKVNEFLKNKVSADTTKKRINSLTMELMEARNTVDTKNKELSTLQINSEGHLKVLETDLQVTRDTVIALKDRNKDLEDLLQVTKSQNKEMESDNTKLHAMIRELREEIKVLQGYLDTANDQIQDLRLTLQEKTQENTVASSQLEKIKQLEIKLEQCKAEQEITQDTLRHKEEGAQRFQQELQVSKEALWKVEKMLEDQELELKFAQNSVVDMEEQTKLANQKVHDSQATVRQQEAELARLKEVLRRTEKELDERVAHLEQRCLFSEEERSKTQEEGLRRVQELRTELNSLKEVTKIMKEEMDKVVKQKEEEIKRVHEGLQEHQERQFAEAKEREENLRYVQTQLAQKDEKMKAMEANHTGLISQLQQELHLHIKEKEDVLVLLDEQRGHSVNQLQNEIENVQKLLEEVSLEKQEIMEKLQEEREERVQIQATLHEERAALEVERKDHHQVRTEVLVLKAELESVDEEKKQFLAQVELKDKTTVVLENQLKRVEQERNQLQSHLADIEQECVMAKTIFSYHFTLNYLTSLNVCISVCPQEQLNAFAAERNALLNENGTNQEELNKLADAYARLLGHQNQKQKIKHVTKLKDENISLKQEVSKLRSQVSRQKSDLEQLKSKLPCAPQRRFDPSKAFQHNKENRQTEATEPLKQGKRYTDLTAAHSCAVFQS
uniref:Hyaluronan-mediated motility receptor (RHAMM) n=1 Tax=Echeneis naucrates TaxID=173247 RepID=A0A665UAU2_ECHNA